ncbi:MAG TPA: ABC transporter substrate-binding protein [Thermomicrobiales bacterium]|nr:ABC transporter substrate-binding protein [Thermomicrobiales bacterium]
MDRTGQGMIAGGNSPAAKLTRRQALRGGAALGLAAVAAGTALRAAPSVVRAGARRSLANGATLIYASYGSPVDLDPHSAVEDRSALAIRGAYDQLIVLKEDKTDEYDGLLAERWEANADKSVWIFHLRDGVAFQNGSPCDAEAVRASFERLLTLGLAPVSEFQRFLSDPAQITAPDPKTVVFDLGRPQPLFEAVISSQYGGQIVNAKLAKTHEADGDWGHAWAQLNAEGMGTGPYRITQFEPDQTLTMARHDGYWRGWNGDHFDQIVIRVVPEPTTQRQLIETGDADIVDNLTPEANQALAGNPAVTVVSRYSTQVNYVILTVAGPLKTPAARQAMNYAFPYDDVVNGVYKGFGKRAVGPVAALTRGFAPDTFTYRTDLAKAKELFAQAGVAPGTELTLMMQSDAVAMAAAMQLFQANLAQIGIKLAIQQVDYATFTSILFRDVDPAEQPNVLPWGWWPSYNDAWDHLQAQVLCDSAGSLGTNAGYYCDPKIDALMQQARDAVDPAAYQQAMSEIQQILSRDDPPAIYYIQPQWVTVLRKAIEGFVFNPIYVGTFDWYRLRRG